MVDWNSRYRNADTPWCKGHPHPMLTPMLDRILPPGFAGNVVVPGCGRGWDLPAIASARPDATIIGIDVSKAAIDDAFEHIGNHPRIALMLGDFLDPDWLGTRVGMADFLWEHTCFCAIDPSRRADYAASASTILRPGATLAGMFFLDLDDAGGGPPWNCPRSELDDHFHSEFHILHTQLADDTFEGRHGEEHAVIMRRRHQPLENAC